MRGRRPKGQLSRGLPRGLFIAQMGAWLREGRFLSSVELSREMGLFRPTLVAKLKALEQRGLTARAGKHWNSGYPTREGWLEWYRLCAEPALVDTRPEHHKTAINRNPNHGRWNGRMRTIHQEKVVPPDGKVLMKGSNNQKLGGLVTKGRLRGYKIVSLTLEERATCSPQCEMLATCYGNSMRYAKRFDHTASSPTSPVADLLLSLASEIAANPRVLVRLHTLGDFYSASYVDFWRRLLLKHKQLHVFGFSRWHPGTPIGNELQKLKLEMWPRFAMRFSFLPGKRNALVVPDWSEKPKGSFWCPQQTGKVRDCGSCGACWATDRTVAFQGH